MNRTISSDPAARPAPRRAAAGLVVFLCAAGASSGLAEQPSPDLQTMQREIEDLKRQMRALREQIEALTRGARDERPATAPPAAPEPEAPPAAPASPAQAPRASSTIFNPAISGVFEAIGNVSVSHDRDEDGFSLSEGEAVLTAAVDPYAKVDLVLAFSAEGEAGFEEATVTTTSLPGSLQVKGGRFLSAFGKWNRLHDHQFPTVDRPDALVTFLGDEGLAADGVSLSWLVPGTESVYLESISEVASTGNEISFNAEGHDPLYLQHVASVFTLTPNATIGLGLSGAAGKAGPTEALLVAIDEAGLAGAVTPSGSLASGVFGADITWKWKPVQYNVYRSFTWQTEVMASRREVESLDPGGLLRKGTLRSAGGYSLLEWQFAKRWRAGLRYDATGFPDDEEARQRALSAVLRIQPTEFQEFRIQFKHTGRNAEASARFDDIRSDNEIFFEWIPAIGAHAAHPY